MYVFSDIINVVLHQPVYHTYLDTYIHTYIQVINHLVNNPDFPKLKGGDDDVEFVEVSGCGGKVKGRCMPIMTQVGR